MPREKETHVHPKTWAWASAAVQQVRKGKQATRPSMDEQTNVGHPCHGNECRPRDSRVGPGGGTQSPATPPETEWSGGRQGRGEETGAAADGRALWG